MNNEMTLDQRATQLQMSPTMARVLRMADAVPINTKEELKTAMMTMCLSVIEQIDSGELVAHTTEAKATIHALIGIAIDSVSDRKLKDIREIVQRADFH